MYARLNVKVKLRWRAIVIKSTLLLLSVLLSFNVRAEVSTNRDPETIPNSALQQFDLN